MYISTPSSSWTYIFGGRTADRLNPKFHDGKFRMPENFECIEEKYKVRFSAGMNDWETSWTAVCGKDFSGKTVWFEIAYTDDEHPGAEGLSKETIEKNSKRAKKILSDWIRISMDIRLRGCPDCGKRLYASDLVAGLAEIASDIKTYGISHDEAIPYKQDPYINEGSED